MAQIKVVIGDPKTKQSLQQEFKDDAAKPLLGLRIGDKIAGEALDFSGYEFEITGGSDFAGFPMRTDVPGFVRKKILAVNGVGVKNKKKYRKKKQKGLRTMKGMRQRVTVAGNTVYEKTAQVNVKVVKHGPTPLPFVKKEAAAEGEKKAE